MRIQELNNRLNEINIELLFYLSCSGPNESFFAFDKQKLVRFTQFYPKKISARDLMTLEIQLETYIMQDSEKFYYTKRNW